MLHDGIETGGLRWDKKYNLPISLSVFLIQTAIEGILLKYVTGKIINYIEPISPEEPASTIE